MSTRFLFTLLIGITSFSPALLSQQRAVDTPARLEDAFCQEIKRTENRIIYTLDMNRVSVEHERSAFVNALYKSRNIVVTSRIDAQGILHISTDKLVTKAQVETELATILAASKNATPSTTPGKY